MSGQMLMAVAMVLTFVGAVVTMLVGVSGMRGEAAGSAPNKSTRLMALRVGLCFCLLLETMVYLAYFKT
jgi:NADH:ubiquinone oxidoreductase subunit 6 (subunit J)